MVVHLTPTNPLTIQRKITTSSLRKQCRVEAALVDEEIFQSPVNVMKGWNKHFGDLAKKSNNNSFDTKYLNSIEKETTHIINMCTDTYIHQEITTEEIKKSCLKTQHKQC